MKPLDPVLYLAAAELGPSVTRGDDPPRSAPLAWWIALSGPVQDAQARATLRALVQQGLLAANRLGELSDLTDEASRLHLTPAGLAAALESGLQNAARRPGLCDLVRIELGAEFHVGVLAPVAIEPELTASQSAALLLLHHRPCWSLMVMALLLKAFVESGRLDLGDESVPKAGFTVPWLRKKLAVLVSLFPALTFAKAGARATIEVIGPLPSLVCSIGQEPVSLLEVADSLDETFGMAHVQPLASLPRTTRSQGRITSEGDDDMPEPELDLDLDD